MVDPPDPTPGYDYGNPDVNNRHDTKQAFPARWVLLLAVHKTSWDKNMVSSGSAGAAVDSQASAGEGVEKSSSAKAWRT